MSTGEWILMGIIFAIVIVGFVTQPKWGVTDYDPDETRDWRDDYV